MRVNPQGGMKSGLQGNPQGDLEGDFQGNPQCINLQCHPQRHARWSLKKLKKPTKSIYLNILFYRGVWEVPVYADTIRRTPCCETLYKVSTM